jgi:SAM-dependent methyltransferase
VTKDLADRVEGVPARFVPQEMRGELVEAEHLARYRWAAQLATHQRVLDAGCGVGYGSVILAEAGASDVVGVDIGAAVVAAASAADRPGLRFEQGDIAQLPAAEGSFDVVVCFEVIEHVENPDAVLDEFVRVVAPGGLVVVSSPNRDAYVPGNPHHHVEFTPSEFWATLANRWRHVRLLRQHNWIGSAVFEDEVAAAEDASLDRVGVHKVAAQAPGSEPYTLALATDAELPQPPPALALTGVTEVRRWLEHYDAQQRMLDNQRQALAEQGLRNVELSQVRKRLIEVENELATHADLGTDSSEYQRLQNELLAVSQALQDVMSSPSWRLTSPLRAAKRSLTRLRR